MGQDLQSQSQPKQISGQNVFINFFGEVSSSSVQGLMALFLQVSGQNPSSISFLFSSPGGDVSSGITLYNFLKSLGVEIIIYNMGSIDSIATIVFLAGNKRYACPHATFLLHGVSLSLPGNVSLSSSLLKELDSKVEKDEEKIAGILANGSEMEIDEIKEFFKQGVSKDLSFAKEKKIIDEIKSPVIGNSLCINFASPPIVR